MSALHFEAFGERLTSDIPFPELRAVEAGPARWSFEVAPELTRMPAGELLGEERIYADVHARLYRCGTGYRIAVDDTGMYDLTEGGRRIRWCPTPDPWWDFGRAHLIGRVLATSMQLDGILSVHASAVSMADGVVGFLAPKHFGKSTLAMTMYRAGAPFVTDDTLPIVAGADVVARPGVHSLRVRVDDEGSKRLAGDLSHLTPGRDGKVFLPPFPAGRVLRRPAPLAALYFLRPVDPGQGDEGPVRQRLPGMAAAMRLLGETKIGTMLGSTFAGTLLDTVVTITSRVPVYELSVVRDLDRLPDVVAALSDWHGVPAVGRLASEAAS